MITPDMAARGIEEAFRMLEGRWKRVIIFHLFARKILRFSELEKAIPGVSQKMVIQQLRELGRDGIARFSSGESEDDARDLPKQIREEIEKFFVATDELENKELKFLGWKGPKGGEKLIDQAARQFKKSNGKS
jgi:hypothetical protein